MGTILSRLTYRTVEEEEAAEMSTWKLKTQHLSTRMRMRTAELISGVITGEAPMEERPMRYMEGLRAFQIVYGPHITLRAVGYFLAALSKGFFSKTHSLPLTPDGLALTERFFALTNTVHALQERLLQGERVTLSAESTMEVIAHPLILGILHPTSWIIRCQLLDPDLAQLPEGSRSYAADEFAAFCDECLRGAPRDRIERLRGAWMIMTEDASTGGVPMMGDALARMAQNRDAMRRTEAAERFRLLADQCGRYSTSLEGPDGMTPYAYRSLLVQRCVDLYGAEFTPNSRTWAVFLEANYQYTHPHVHTLLTLDMTSQKRRHVVRILQGLAVNERAWVAAMRLTAISNAESAALAVRGSGTPSARTLPLPEMRLAARVDEESEDVAAAAAASAPAPAPPPTRLMEAERDVADV